MSSPISCYFKVHRHESELITPAKPTPHEYKPLSDIDDQDDLRFHIPVLQIYRNSSSVKGKDPVKVIREALAKTLVYYYPFAGRLREWANRKLVVECTGEGALFIEADADFDLENSGDMLQPPFHYLKELLFDVPGSSGVVNCPLLLVQVTRLRCGGFVVAYRVNHTMNDAAGLSQFLTAIGEMARGEHSPSVLPVWERHVLNARNPPKTTCMHREYDDSTSTIPFPLDNLVDQAFFFGPTEISRIRRYAPSKLSHFSTFEILTACLWKCRTIALQPDPNSEMRMICLNNARYKFNPDFIPKGYYGNAFMLSTAVATAEDLIRNPIEYAIELIRKTKSNMTREYVQSVADTLVIKGRPLFPMEGTYIISNVRHAGFREVDYGWGKAIYGGPPKAVLIIASFCVPAENRNRENGFGLPICLPAQAMERFVKEMRSMLQIKPINGDIQSIQSAL